MARPVSSDPLSAAVVPPAQHGRGAYGQEFWLAYAANALVMTSVSMFVRYADFVTYLGGGEGQLGLIVGVGMVGSLAVRLTLGVGMDRYGSRKVWLASLSLYVASLMAHLAVQRADGTDIFLVRTLMQTSIAGIFGASITSISRRVSADRMAEIVGTLGTSGFLGVLLGPQLADHILGSRLVGRPQVDGLFLCAAALGVLSLIITWFATQDESPPARRRGASVFALLRRYNPGLVLLVAIAVGAGLVIPNTFLRPFAAERHIPTIGVFFAVYAVSAFSVRLLARRSFARHGNRPWVLCGLTLMGTSIPLYLIVHHAWQFVVPGVVSGAGHAILFPSVVASGSTCFPERHRGLGTTLMLAMFDTGHLIGAPLVGGILHFSRHLSLPAYPTMFVTMATLVAMVAGAYWRWDRPEVAHASILPHDHESWTLLSEKSVPHSQHVAEEGSGTSAVQCPASDR